MIINNWLGIRNQNPIRSIPDNALTDAIDVDIDDAGILSQRPGKVFAHPVSLTTAYSTIDHAGYIVAAGVLNRVLPDLSTIPIVNSAATEFCDSGKVLFTNDGYRIEDDIATDLNIPVSDNPPNLSAVSGSLPVGTYRAMFCYRSSTGLEGGSSPVGSITLAAIGGVAIEPISTQAGFTVAVYMTDADGTVFYDNNGAQINPVQVLAESFPANAEQIAFYDRRLFLSESLSNGTSVIRFSKPYYFHIYDFATDYIIIQGRILVMMGTPQGLIIGTDSAIYVYDTALQQLSTYGVVQGRSISKLPDGNVLINTQRGVCSALPFTNLTETKAVFAPGAQCSTAIVDQDGMKKFVVLTDGSGSPYNARSFRGTSKKISR